MHILKLNSKSELALTGFSHKVSAGFPSPADDHLDQALDLNKHLIKHPSATFYCRISGSSMTEAGIFDGDIIIVDRALTAEQGDIVLAALNGELTCKILDIKNGQLLPANKEFNAITVQEADEMIIEGVVINSIREHHK